MIECIKELLEKMESAASAISIFSKVNDDEMAASAVEHLAKAVMYLTIASSKNTDIYNIQIQEEE